MIPDHIIDRAAEAAMNAPYDGETPTPTTITNAHPVDAQAWRDAARAVIGVVAARIWNQGWEAGMSYVVSTEHSDGNDEYLTNPYERKRP